MDMLQLRQLNNKQKLDIEKLVQECLLAEGLERTLYLSNDMNFYENLDCFYLLYDNDKLISVLTIFQPLETEAEISAYTLPAERNKGYFTELLDYAEEELIGYDIFRILFVTEPASGSGVIALKACQAKYKNSEYLLALYVTETNNNSSEDVPVLELMELQPQNIIEAALLSAIIFDSEKEESLVMLENALESEQIESYLVYKANEMIGIGNVNYGIHNASIFGLGISPKHQRNGYGRRLLNLLLEKIGEHKAKYITLEVGSDNHTAFSLYRSAGFEIKTQYDYHEYIIECEEVN